jgi:hypothetical protein
MLRFTAAAAGGAPPHIVRDFDDAYLELVRLLREASEIEHALLVQYLYASFSVRQRYADVIGTGGDDSISLVGVAVQEMHHLARVNELLGQLRAAPNLVRQDFPYEPDIYPFELTLEPLSRRSCAKYVYAEAPAVALDPDDPSNADPASQEFIAAVLGELGGGARPNHIGSLYGTIIERLQDVITAAIPGLPELSPWIETLDDIRVQGEEAHYRFFRSLFTGEAFGVGPGIWSLDPSDDAYPAHDIGTDPSAFEGHPHVIAEPHRRTAWLGNLHYWLVLGLLDLGLRSGDADGTVGFQAVRHMTTALRPLGTHLAGQGVGLPFDPLSMGYAPGHDTPGTVFVLRRLAQEAARTATALIAALPVGMAQRLVTLTDRTVVALDALSPPPTPSQGGGTGGGGDADTAAAAIAMDFWFDFDNRFQDAPSVEAIQAMVGLGNMDVLVDTFVQRVGEGTVATAFRDDVAPLRPTLVTLSRLQLAAFDDHFHGDDDVQRVAFEHFGQGDLFDERRPGNEVHMMDAGFTPPVGYHRWRAILRAMTVLGIEASRWQAIGRQVALAWAIQSEARPRQAMHNTPLPPERLATLRTHWLARSDDEIDAAFASGPRPAPVP